MKLEWRKKKSAGIVQEIQKEINEDFAEEAAAKIEPFAEHCWISICIEILSRNISRADFEILKNGRVEKNSASARLFAKPNPALSCFDLWKQTVSYWSLYGECFWWFGKDYSAGMPRELHVINPSRMSECIENGKITKWFCSAEEGGQTVIFPNELVHFKDWNPWNEYRGLSPLKTLGYELEQDILATRQNTVLLKEGGIPKGILKTDQILTDGDAERIERMWDKKYSAKNKRRIAVLGKGTEYQSLTFTPDALKLYDMKQWNLYTILAKYGIPPRVANIKDSKSSLSGTDTDSQHRAFWNFTLIPLLKNFEQILDVQFFSRFAPKETGRFNLLNVPELQESEDAQSRRDIEEIRAGLKTINDVLAERGLPGKPWGDLPGLVENQKVEAIP